MPKHVILITGTPCVGKTTVARLLASKTDACYVNLTEIAIGENLILGKDKERNTVIVDENKMRRRLQRIIKDCKQDNVIVDGHYAGSVVPKNSVTRVFVLRRDPVELRKFMEKCGFSGQKLWENLASEILDVCLVEALGVLEKDKVCELDATYKSAEEIVKEILAVLNGAKKSHVGIVDWLSKLENEGLLEEFLKI